MSVLVECSMATPLYMRLHGMVTVELSRNLSLPRQMLTPSTAYVQLENVNSCGCCDSVIVCSIVLQTVIMKCLYFLINNTDCVFFFLQLSAITQTSLDRHSSNRRHQCSLWQDDWKLASVVNSCGMTPLSSNQDLI